MARKPSSLADLARIKTKPAPKPSFIGVLENRYLGVAVDKLTNPLHPNFVAALKARRKVADQPTSNEERIHKMRTVVARAFDAAKGDGKLTVIGTLRLMAANSQAFNDGDLVYFAKETLSAVAFHANIEVNQLLRIGTPVDESIGENLLGDDDHDLDLLDAALFDESTATRNAPQEQHQPDTMASNPQDAIDAIENIQAWLGAIFVPSAKLSDKDRQAKIASFAFWGVDGMLPMGSFKRSDGEWVPITDFETYRIKSREAWLNRQNAVNLGPDLIDVLEAA